MDEILYELRDHASGLNAGRWDYLFSIIKYFRDSGPEFVLPDRGTIGMPTPFMRAYAELLVKTCHRRGAFAIGGMSAFIPSRKDKEANERAFAKVREDKQREAGQGFDGSWVAHPDLVPVCQEVFDAVLGDKPNQLDVLRDDVHVIAEDLLDIASADGQITRQGLESNVEIGARYLEAWLGGLGAVGIHNLMEDAATAEISRSQIWQWVHNDSTLDDGTPITKDLVRDVMSSEQNKIRAELGEQYTRSNFDTAFTVLEQVALADDYVDFLTLPAYEAASA
jgi:malate synthase